MKKMIGRILCVVAALALATGAGFLIWDMKPVKVQVDLEQKSPFGTFDGFGTSIAWWGHASQDWDDSLKEEVVDLLFDAETGLGMQIARYNIGAGDQPDHDHMGPYRQMPAFQPEKGQWDWEADAAQRDILLRAMKKGVSRTEAFANSPPYWMTVSGCTGGAGEESKGVSNLRPDQYDAYADYLTEVVQYYQDEYDISFDTLSPINEPNNHWWFENCWQEGCHYDNGEEMDRMVDAVTKKLQEKSLTTKLSFDDETAPKQTIENFSSLTQSSQDKLEILNTHTYHANSRFRKQLKETAVANNKTVYMSEVDSSYSKEHDHNSFPAALGLAQNISYDLNDLQPKGWVFWQAVECEEHMLDGAGNWGLLHVNFTEEEKACHITKKYYAFAQYAKYIRQGSTLIDSGDKNISCAYQEKDGSVVFVAVNDSRWNKTFQMDLSQLEQQTKWEYRGAAISATVTDSTRNLAPLEMTGEITFASNQFFFPSHTNTVKVTLPKQSIATFVINPA